VSYANMPVRPVGYIVPASEWSQIGENFRNGVPDIFTTAGDLAVGAGLDAAARLALGIAGQWPMSKAGALSYGDLRDLVAASFVDATVTSSSDTPEAKTGGPSVTIKAPASGNFLIGLFADMHQSSASGFAALSVYDGTNVLAQPYVIHRVGVTLANTHGRFGIATGYTPGSDITFTMYYSRADTGTASFLRRFIMAVAW
jgi:hypothetical protein